MKKSCDNCRYSFKNNGTEMDCTAFRLRCAPHRESFCGSDLPMWEPAISCSTCKFSALNNCLNVSCVDARAILGGDPGSCRDHDKWDYTYEEFTHEVASERPVPVPAAPPVPDPDTLGMKHDTGKVDLSLLEYFPNALKAVCMASEFGCTKYERGSFKDVPNARKRYTAAMLGHYFGEGTDDEPNIDKDSGLPEDFMVAWNALCRLELRLRGYKLDGTIPENVPKFTRDSIVSK